MCPGVALQVKGVIEALSAEGAEIALGVAVALHVPVQQSLQGELLGAYPALELGRVRVGPHRGQLLLCLDHPVRRQRVLESVAAVDQLDGGVRRNAELRGRNRWILYLDEGIDGFLKTLYLQWYNQCHINFQSKCL